MVKGVNEKLLYDILEEAYPGKWESDTTFLEGRKFRGDAVNKEDKIVIEIDGGTFPFYMKLKNGKTVLATKGGHSSPEGIRRDMEKSNAMILEGWRPLRYTPETLKTNPWKIRRDLAILMGAPADQRTLDFDALKDEGEQRKICHNVREYEQAMNGDRYE